MSFGFFCSWVLGVFFRLAFSSKCPNDKPGLVHTFVAAYKMRTQSFYDLLAEMALVGGFLVVVDTLT